MWKRHLLLPVGILCVLHGLIAQSIIRITPENFGPSGSYVWSSANTYILEGDLILESGTLFILPGTNIFISEENIQSTGLTIGENANILANGTSGNPIHFSLRQSIGFDEIYFENNWKGLHIKQDSESSVSRLTYVSIAHAGAPVQSQTGAALYLENLHDRNIIEFVEVFGSLGDGVRIWGGEVNLKNIVSSFVQDDSFEWDYGWEGYGLYWFGYSYGAYFPSREEGDYGHLLEGHGNIGLNGRVSEPNIFNATLIGGSCEEASFLAENNVGPAILLSDNTKGLLANCLIADISAKGIEVQDSPGNKDSKDQVLSGNLSIKNNVWSKINVSRSGPSSSDPFDLWSTDFGSTETGILSISPNADDPIALFLTQHLISQGNTILKDELYANRKYNACLAIDPRLREKLSGASSEMAKPPETDFFRDSDASTQKGAFSRNDELWISQWTKFDHFALTGEDIRIGFLYQDTILQDGGTIRISCEDYSSFHNDIDFSIWKFDCLPDFDFVFSSSRRGNRRRRPRRKNDTEIPPAFIEDWEALSANSDYDCHPFPSLKFTLEVIDTIPPEIRIIPDGLSGVTAYLEDCDDAWFYEKKVDTLTFSGNAIRLRYIFKAEDYSGNRSQKEYELITLDSAPQTFYADLDMDGFGNPDMTIEALFKPEGFVENGGDCNDADAEVPLQISCNNYQSPDVCTISPEIEVQPYDDFSYHRIVLDSALHPSVPGSNINQCSWNEQFRDYWVKFVPNQTYGLTLKTRKDNVDYPVRLQLYSGSCGSLHLERCFEDYFVGEDLTLEFLDPNKTYFLRIQDKANYLNYFDLALLEFNPLNDLPTFCNRAEPLIFSNLNSCEERTIWDDDAPNGTALFRFVVPQSGELSFTLKTESFFESEIPGLVLFKNVSCDKLNPILLATGTEANGNIASIGSKDLSPGEGFWLGVFNARAYNGPFAFKLTSCTGDQVTSTKNQITNNNNIPEIQIYPNPTQGTAFLQFKTSTPQQLEINLLDLNGQRLQTILSSQPISREWKKQIDLSHLPAGVYLIQWQTIEHLFTTKLIRS